MKIAILGTRGVPPSYGGFETMAAELGTRLVARGHDVTVYCRKRGDARAAHGPSTLPGADDDERFWRGIRRIVLPSLPGKYFETVSHTFVSALDAAGRGYDAALLCNAANAFVLPLLRAARVPVAINVDGIERKRRKWNVLGRAVYASGEAFSVSFASRIIADAAVIARYYRDNYAAGAVMIPYGAEFPDEPDTDVVSRLGLSPRGYLLYVSRFEPENNPLETVLAYEAFSRGAATVVPPLVMLGSGLYAPDLVAELKRHESPAVIFPGALYGADYRTLQRNALLYIQSTEVGGTHPALIEAMASGGAVIAHDTPENREAGGDTIGYFRLRPQETLSGIIGTSLAGAGVGHAARERTREYAVSRFSWDRVTDAYEGLFREIAVAGSRQERQR